MFNPNRQRPGNRIPQALPPKRPNPINPPRSVLEKLATVCDLYRGAIQQGGGQLPSILTDPELVKWLEAMKQLK